MKIKRNIDIRLILLIAMFSSFLSFTLWSQEFGESILIEQSVSEDLYLAAKNIDVLATVDSDLVAAGRRITIEGQVSGDLILAGETLSIQGMVLDDLRAAGKTINVTGDIAGHMVAAGQHIVIERGTNISDWAWLAGEMVDIKGDVNGDIKIAGATIFIDSEIGGDAELIAEDIRIGPNAIIRGDLTWRSSKSLDRSEAAQIDGQIIEMSLPEDWYEEDEDRFGSSIFVILSLAIPAIVLYLLLPAYSTGAARLLGNDHWKCLGTGVAVLFITPILGLLLSITLIGYLLGLAVFMAYLFCLIIGLLMAVIIIAELILRLFKKHEAATNWTWVLAILASAISIVLVGNIPYLGALLVLLIWLYGLGFLSLSAIRKYVQA